MQNCPFHRWHLLTSFLYGLLRPLDGILPYRMEGNVELPNGEGQNLFGFWKNRLTNILIEAVKADGGTLVHLATEEYQHLFDWQRVRKEIRVIQPLFYQDSTEGLFYEFALRIKASSYLCCLVLGCFSNLYHAQSHLQNFLNSLVMSSQSFIMNTPSPIIIMVISVTSYFR